MENKKTTELLDLLDKKRKEDKWDEETSAIVDELKSREPFYSLWKPGGNDVPMDEELEDIKGDIKLLKRHKHDQKTDDVMVRI